MYLVPLRSEGEHLRVGRKLISLTGPTIIAYSSSRTPGINSEFYDNNV